MEEIKIGDLIIKPSLNKESKEAHPAIGVVDDVAYVGVWIPCQVIDKDRNIAHKDLLFLVTDRKEVILANDEELRKRDWKLAYKPVKFQNRWPLQCVQEYLKEANTVDPCQMFYKLVETWKAYVDFQDEREYLYHALWDIGSYLHHFFNAYPYPYIGGVKRCGKTKTLTVHSCLAFNAFFSNNMSTSSIYRLIQNARGTLVIDENEKLSQPDRALEFRSLLLSGYKKGAKVYRVEKNRKEELHPEAFEIYSPKVLANIQGLEDVLEDRCKNVYLKRSRNKDILNRDVDENNPQWSKLRNELYVFYLAYWKEILEIYHALSECSEPSVLVNSAGGAFENVEGMELLVGRELELWKGIFAIAIFLDKKLHLTKYTNTLHSPSSLTKQMLELAIDGAEQRRIENMTETGEAILLHILLQLVKDDGYLKVKTIRDEMAKQFDEEQKWLSTRWIGNALRRFGFKEKRRVGTGYEYFFSVSEVQDLAKRMEIDAPPFNLDNILTIATIPETQQGKCGYCSIEGPINREAVLHNKDRIALCDDCAWKIEKQMQKEE